MFSESLCKELFCESRSIGSRTVWLMLRGANGLDIPYTGYLVVNFKVRGVHMPAKRVVVIKDKCLVSYKAL